jgi:hypothetical protein
MRPSNSRYLKALAVEGAKSKNGYTNNYLIQSVKNLQLRLIETFDSPEAAEQYLEKNLDHPDFRRRAIEKAVARENYPRVLELCQEGERIDREYPGLVREWRQTRYEVYEKQHDTEGQRQLAREFVVDEDFEYYGKFKALYASDEWPLVLAALLEDLERQRYLRSTYIAVCVEERLEERLLAVCRQDPEKAVKLYPHLVPQYAGELDAVFRDLIEKEAKCARDREAYRQVCCILRHYVKACGTTGAKETIAELRAVYHSRPAFMDELRRLNI